MTQKTVQKKHSARVSRGKSSSSAAKVSSSSAAVITFNSRSIIISWNAAAAALFGYTSAEAVGRDISLIIPEEFVKLNRLKMKLADETSRAMSVGNPVQIIARHKAGTEIIVKCQPVLKKVKGELFFTITIDPASEDILSGTAGHSPDEHLKELHHDVDDYISHVVRSIGGQLKPSCVFYQAEEGGLLRTIAGWHVPEEMKCQIPKAGSARVFCFSRFKGRMACVPDLDRAGLTETDSIIGKYRYKTMIGCRVETGKKDHGFIGVFYKEKKDDLKFDLNILRNQAKGLAAYLQLVEKFEQRLRYHRVSESYLKRLSRGILEVGDLERKNLSITLHDELGAMAVALGAHLAIAEKKVTDNDNAAALREFLRFREILDDSIEGIKNVAQNLMPPEFDILGLQSVLKNYLSGIQDKSGMKIDFKWDLSHVGINDNTAIVLYRLIQESVNNCIKHAAAESVVVLLRFADEMIVLSVIDDGEGFDADAVNEKTCDSRMGIRGMRERVQSMGGSFDLMTSPGKGTEILIRVPYKEVSV